VRKKALLPLEEMLLNSHVTMLTWKLTTLALAGTLATASGQTLVDKPCKQLRNTVDTWFKDNHIGGRRFSFVIVC
jgi:hypothetical protein